MEQHLKTANFLANFLDAQFKIAGFRFGFAAIIDLIPGFGDFLDAALSLYIVWIGVQLKLPQTKIIQMIFNVLVSFVIGLIPVAGDIAYIFYKANLRNLAIINDFVAKHEVVEGHLLP